MPPPRSHSPQATLMLRLPHASRPPPPAPSPLPPPQRDHADGHTNISNIARLLTLPPDREEDITMLNLLDGAPDPPLTSVRSLVERTPHNPDRFGRNPIRDPLDNYTDADMPQVHDSHPTTPFQFIHLDLISEWENLTGGKLLIIPFGDAAREPKLHDLIKNRILYAVAEITSSKDVGVSAPSPSDDAIRAKRSPSSFLVYNLTLVQKSQLLDRGVWSSQAITFRAVPFFPMNPDYLFSIKGFSLIITQHVQTLVYNVWHNQDTATFMQNLIDAAPERDRVDLTFAISSFLDTLSVTCLNIKERGGVISPCFNIYAKGASIPDHKTWLEIRQYLSKRIYFTLLTGRGETTTNPYNCGLCHGVEHPKGLCPFPDVTGWNGPSKDQNAENRRGRNGG
jgi:hypothetical protein